MKNAILQYIKKGKKCPKLVGVMVALKDLDGKVGIGVSRCNLKKDKFSKSMGMAIAFGRAHKNINDPHYHGMDFLVPKMKNVEAFKERAKRYFKVEAVNY